MLETSFPSIRIGSVVPAVAGAAGAGGRAFGPAWRLGGRRGVVSGVVVQVRWVTAGSGVARRVQFQAREN